MNARCATAMRAGSFLLLLASVGSFAASPDLIASLPWVLLLILGSGLVLAALYEVGSGALRLLTSNRLSWFFVVLGYVALLAVLFGTKWPSYKLSWLSPVFAALPSVRSLPVGWMAEGIQPNQAGGILAVWAVFSIALALLYPGWPRIRIAALPVAALSPVLVFMTGSRASLVGLGVALLLLLSVRDRRWLLTLSVGLFALFAVALFWPDGFARLTAVVLRDETVDTKLLARLDIWTSVLQGIEDHSVTGIGLGVFNEVIPIRYPYATVGLSYTVSQGHNIFLDTALGLGIPGLIGLVLLLGGAVWQGVTAARARTAHSAYFFGLLASICVYLVFGLTDSLSFSSPLSLSLWLWMVGIVLPFGAARETAISERKVVAVPEAATPPVGGEPTPAPRVNPTPAPSGGGPATPLASGASSSAGLAAAGRDLERALGGRRPESGRRQSR